MKWEGNTGGYHLYRTRETGRILRELLALAAEEKSDSEDYSDRALEIVTNNNW